MSASQQVVSHTPGPWSWDDGRIVSAAGEYIATAPESRYNDGGADDEAAPNARLLAEAPALLSALRTMVENYIDLMGDEGEDAPPSIKAALAVIAKATGGAQ